MTEESTEPEDDGTPEADWIKQLRKDAARAKTLEKEVATLRRHGAMDDLGIPKTGAGKLFRDKWDGDPTDLDALRAAAAEYELIPTEPSPEAEDVSDAIEAAERIATAAQGGTSEPTVDALLSGATSMKDLEEIARNAGIAPSQA